MPLNTEHIDSSVSYISGLQEIPSNKPAEPHLIFISGHRGAGKSLITTQLKTFLIDNIGIDYKPKPEDFDLIVNTTNNTVYKAAYQIIKEFSLAPY